jgi:hypothetical protein
MKSKYGYLCGTIILSILIALWFNGCKNFGVPDYQLKVTIETGAHGTPTSGEYSHQELTEIDYNYLPDNEEHIVEVIVNGGRWATTGVFTIYTNLDVEVRVFDIRGTWNFILQSPTDSEDDPLEFVVTFSGDNFLSGTFSDDRGFSGLWSISGNALTMNYNDWQNYILTGTVPTMTGNWTGENKSSTWRASR